MKTKTCTKCKQVLPLTKFYKHPDGRDGYNSTCKFCCIRQAVENYQKKHPGRKPEERKDVSKQKSPHTGVMDGWTEWHELPPEVIAEMSEEEYREYCRWWCKAHPIDLEAIAKGLLAGMRNVMDDYDHTNTKEVKFDR